MPYALREGLPERPDGPILGDWFMTESVDEPNCRYPISALLQCPGCRKHIDYFLSEPPDSDDNGRAGNYCFKCRVKYGKDYPT